MLLGNKKIRKENLTCMIKLKISMYKQLLNYVKRVLGDDFFSSDFIKSDLFSDAEIPLSFAYEKQ